MEDVFLSIITIIGFIVLLVVIFVGIQWMVQQSANLSGNRHTIKVNGATMFDARPKTEYRYHPKYVPAPAPVAKPKVKNRRVFVYNPSNKTIMIVFFE